MSITTRVPQGRRRERIALLALGAALLLLAACGGSDSQPFFDPQKSDFSLEDVNTASATYQANVSPRQHTGKVSAWYFGHST